jgi:hypothetical protein
VAYHDRLWNGSGTPKAIVHVASVGVCADDAPTCSYIQEASGKDEGEKLLKSQDDARKKVSKDSEESKGSGNPR